MSSRKTVPLTSTKPAKQVLKSTPVGLLKTSSVSKIPTTQSLPRSTISTSGQGRSQPLTRSSVSLQPNVSSLVPTIQPVVSSTIVNRISATETGKVERLDRLRNYLRNDLLPTFIPEAAIRDRLVNDKAMTVWDAIFTHQSANINIGYNYEVEEIIGDSILDVHFFRYLRSKYRNTLPPSSMTELRRYYLSKPQQAEMSRQLKMDQYVLVGNIDVTIHIAEDILEAFACGIYDVGDLIKDGFGNLLAKNFVLSLFAKVELDLEVIKGHAKTQVKEIYNKLHWGMTPPEEEYEDAAGNAGVAVLLNEIAMQDLASVGINLTSNVIADVTSPVSKRVASNAAYEQALIYLRSIGITDTWIEQRQAEEDARNPELAPLFSKAYAKMHRENLTSLFFRTAQAGTTGKQMQLIGTEVNGKLVILATTLQPVQRKNEGKRQLLEAYIAK